MSQRPSNRPPRRGDSPAKGGLILILLLVVASVVYAGLNFLIGRGSPAAAPVAAVSAPSSPPASARPSVSAPSSAEAEPTDESGPPLVVDARPQPPFSPKSFADLQAIARGDHSPVALKMLRTDTVGYQGCPQPKVFVTVSPQNPPVKELAAALLGYFFDQKLANDCGASLRGYQTEAQAGGPGTRGEVTLDVQGNPQSPGEGHPRPHLITVSLPDRSSFSVTYTPA